MARCSSYLRGLAICVTVLLLVSGVVMISVGFSSIDGNTPVAELFDQLASSDGLLVLQVFGPITVGLSVLGVCAATMDIKTLLLLFSALIFVEFVALMVVASPLVQVQAQVSPPVSSPQGSATVAPCRQQPSLKPCWPTCFFLFMSYSVSKSLLNHEMDGAIDDVFLNVTPLHREEGYIQTELSKLQASDSCCGLRSFEDWENQLPASCFCTPLTPPAAGLQLNSDPGVSSPDGPCVMVDSDLHPPNPQTTDGLWVHSKPCGPILRSYLCFPIKLRIGIISAFATIAMAAIALCLALGVGYWRTPPVETTVDHFDRVKYQPKPSLS